MVERDLFLLSMAREEEEERLAVAAGRNAAAAATTREEEEAAVANESIVNVIRSLVRREQRGSGSRDERKQF